MCSCSPRVRGGDDVLLLSTDKGRGRGHEDKNIFSGKGRERGMRFSSGVVVQLAFALA